MKLFESVGTPRRKAVWGPTRTLAAALAVLSFAFAPNAMAAGRHAESAGKAHAGRPNGLVKGYKVDNELTERVRSRPNGTTRAIVELMPGAELPAEFARYARRSGRLRSINGQVVDIPNALLQRMSANPKVFRIHHDRDIAKFNYRTSVTVGTRAVQQALGLTGLGVGVAVIDSGITAWHDDLTNRSATPYPYGNQRVAAFVDFVDGHNSPHDYDGHGSHVAGIIAGNGFDSGGVKVGAAPDATLVSLKVLDAQGRGTVSNIIAALDWVLANHTTYNIRVVNMSVGAAIRESAYTDPLTLAAKRVVDAGVVVVAAAGNLGKNSAGQPQYGGITAPANAPWVLTVGASSTNGTAKRTDDTMGSFSSRGPTYIDWAAKPDLVAPGIGTVSLAAAESSFYINKPNLLLPGTVASASLPYLSLSGTSMAAPVVTGTVALMLQANPSLTPNAVKAILQYTAQPYPGYDPLTQGAGFLNAVGAVRLARFYAHAHPGDKVPVQQMWSRHIIWGNHRIGKGTLTPNANAFRTGTTWGAAKTSDGDNIVWGTACGSADCDNIVWGTSGGDNIVWGTSGDGDNIVWGTDGGDNIVWGTDCGSADCDNIVWGTMDGDNIVWGTANAGDNIVWGTAGLNGDNIVWGTDGGDNIVWGTDAGDNIVWGTDDVGDNIVWGTEVGDNIVWGTHAGDNIVWGTVNAGDNIVWGTHDGDNIVWGTAHGDNIVWGTADGDNIVWGTVGSFDPVWLSSPNNAPVRMSGSAVFDRLRDKQLLQLLEYAPQPPTRTPPPPPPVVAPPVVAPPVVAPPVVAPIAPPPIAGPVAPPPAGVPFTPAPVPPPPVAPLPVGGPVGVPPVMPAVNSAPVAPIGPVALPAPPPAPLLPPVPTIGGAR